jgi:hypothetical protein
MFANMSYTTFWGGIAGIAGVVLLILTQAPEGLIDKTQPWVQWVEFISGAIATGAIARAFQKADDAPEAKAELRAKQIQKAVGDGLEKP